MSEFVFKLPDLGEGTVEAEIVEWHVEAGDVVQEGDLVVDVMTDKANIEVPAPVSGTVLRTQGEPGDVIAVGAELMAFTVEAGAAAKAPAKVEPRLKQPVVESAAEPAVGKPHVEPPPTPSPQVPSVEAARATQRQKVLTTPRIRKLAAEQGVDLSQIAGSGPKGRITMEDLDAYLASGSPSHEVAAEPAVPEEAAPPAGGVQERKVIGVRRLIAERLSRSYREIPHFSYVEEVDVTELVALKDHLQDSLERRLSLLPLIATALIRSLLDHPSMNAHYDAEQNLMRTFDAVHLGIATQTADGLKVPVVNNAHALDLWALADAIVSATAAARDGTLSPSGLTGSTITITSLGRLGGIASTPLINYPEVAILGVNKAVDRPVVRDGAVVVRTMMNLSASLDHRFNDGYDAAAWIQTIKVLLEHPARLWLKLPG